MYETKLPPKRRAKLITKQNFTLIQYIIIFFSLKTLNVINGKRLRTFHDSVFKDPLHN